MDSPLLLLLILLPVLFLAHVARQVRKLLGLTRRAHQLLMEIVDHGATEVLQHVLASVRVGTLVEVMRPETVRRFTERALEGGLLCSVSKAVLVDALQMRGIRHNRCGQSIVYCLLLSCRGADLTLLKTLIDGSGGYHNLYKLVYKDITNQAMRRGILRHFAEQALSLRMQHGRAVGVKILSDVDDTLHSSGGLFPAGCDRRFPRHAVYPGFLTLLEALDHQCAASNGPTCNIVFLSARPHVYKDVAEDRSYQLFRGLVRTGHMHSFPTLLPGRTRDGLLALVASACFGASAWAAVGRRKYRVFQHFQDLYREYDYIFCGDNGQGDLLAGQMMLAAQGKQSVDSLEKGAMAPRLLCVLIHRVMPDGACLALEPPSERGALWSAGLLRRGVLLYDTYVGAALALHSYDPKLVTVGQIARVTSAAMEEFDAVRWAHADWGPRWASAEQSLRRDQERASQVLQVNGWDSVPHFRTTHEVLTTPQAEPGRRASPA